MKQELPDPRDAIIARQAIEIEQIKQEYNNMVDQLDKINKLFAEIRTVSHSRYLRF